MRAVADTVGAVVAGDASVVAPFPRAWQAPAGVAPARWVDGAPAALETPLGRGCVRTVGVPVADAGDLVLRPAFRRFVTVLAAGFDSKVNERANAMTWPRGQMRYNLATLAELRVFEPLPYLLDLDGEQRQLEIAMALATRPRLLLLDEPVAGMGLDESQRMVQLLRALRGHHTLVLVEHDMDVVFALADRISVLVYGQVVATAATDQANHVWVRGLEPGTDCRIVEDSNFVSSVTSMSIMPTGFFSASKMVRLVDPSSLPRI